MGDPMGTGLAASLAHRGGNLTGLSLQWGEGISRTRLEICRRTRIARMSLSFSGVQFSREP
jgi:hypothetical protein